MSRLNLTEIIKKAAEVVVGNKVATAISVTVSVVAASGVVKTSKAPTEIAPPTYTEERIAPSTETKAEPAAIPAHAQVPEPEKTAPVSLEEELNQNLQNTAHNAEQISPQANPANSESSLKNIPAILPALVAKQIAKLTDRANDSPAKPTPPEIEPPASAIGLMPGPTATPAEKNTSAPASVSSRDITSPVVAISAPATNSFVNTANTSSITVSGSCDEQGADVKITAKDSSNTVSAGTFPKCNTTATPNFTASIDVSSLADGTITFAIEQKDAAGNIGTKTLTAIKDTVAPTSAVASPDANAFANSGNIAAFTASGTCSDDGRTITVTAGSVTGTTTCASGAWTKSLNLTALAQGNFTVTTDLDDAAGNHAIQASRVFVKDTISPSDPSALALQSPSTSPGNDPTPTIRVSGVVSGNSVGIYADSTCSIPTLKASGTASATTLDLTSSALIEGTYSLYSKTTDPAGNSSDCSSATVSYQYDNTLPTVAITAPDADSFVNSAAVAAITFSGTCSETGQDVTITAGSVTGTVACSAGHTWSKTLNLTALSQGDFNLTADHQDVAGNAATQATRAFKKDTVAPTAPSGLALRVPTTSPGNNSTPTIRVSGVVSTDVVKLFAESTCTTAIATGTATATTIDLTTTALTETAHSLYALSIDPAGNSSTCSTATVSYTYDSHIPTVTITAPAANSWANASNYAAFTVSGDCSENGQNVVITYGETSDNATCTAGHFSKAIDLTSVNDDDFDVAVDLASAAGVNANQDVRTFKKDIAAPTAPSTLALQSPSTSPGTDDTPTIRVGGLVSGNSAKLFTDGTCTTEVASGSATATTLDLTSSAVAEATHNFYANTTDPAGNTSACSTATAAYTYDNSLPTVAISTPVVNTYANIANVAAFTITGTCSEAGRNVVVSSGSVSGTVACANDHTWSKSLNFSTLSEGDFTVTANHSDAAGNTATADTRAFKKDTTAPSAPSALALQSPATSPGNDSTPTVRLSGVVSGNSVGLYADSSCTIPTLKASATASGATLDLTSSALSAGTFDFYALTTDPAGNPSDCSTATVQYVFDNSVPTVTIASPAANSFINDASKSAFVVSGGCSENGQTVTITADSVTETATCTTLAWTKTMNVSTLTDGDITFAADHSDAAGNTATQATRVFKKDVVAPSAPSALTLQDPANSPGNDSTPEIHIAGVVNGNSVKLFSNNTCTTEKSSGSATGTTLDLTSTAVTPGTYDYYANSTDPAGNTSACSTATVQYVYDNSAPTVTITTPVAGSFVNLANKAAFSVSGTCSEAGQNVTVAVGAVSGTVACAGNNTWTKALNLTTITDGTISWTADHSDAAGNAATQASIDYEKDTVAPSAASGLARQSPTTTPNSDNTPTIRISGLVSGNAVALYADSSCTLPTLKSSGTASGTTLDLTSTALTEAQYDFYALTTDPAGNPSDCSTATVAYEYDNSAPTVTIASPAANSFINDASKTAFTVSGACSENGQTVTLTADSVTATATCTTLAWTITADFSSLSEGDISFKADLSDTAGNQAVQASRTFKKDTTAPSAPSSLALQTPSTSPGTVNQPVIRVGGLVSGDAVKLYSDNTCSTEKSSGSASGTTLDLTSSALTEGAYNFYAKSTDPAGNASACSNATVQYVFDETVPTLAITTPAANSFANAAAISTFTVSGTCSEVGKLVTVASGAVTGTVACAGDNTWSKALDYSSLSEGDFTVTADLDDAAGNHATQATRVFKKDVTAPTTPSALALQTPATSPGNDTTPTIRISGLVSGNTVKLFSDSGCSTEKASGTAAGTTLDLTSSALTEATYDFYSNSTDPAGNTSACSTATVQYVLDSSPPTLAITSPASDSYVNNANKTAFTVSGTCSETGQTISLVADSVTSTVTCGGGGTWSKSLDLTNNNDGDFSVTADMDDASGNHATQATRGYKKDVVAPSAPSALTLQSPTTSPGSDSTPTVRVAGLVSGNSAKLFSDSSCTTEKAAGTAAGTTLDLTSSVLTAATYDFYANTTDVAGNISACSTATVQYEYDNSAPTLAITAPVANSYINIANKSSYSVSGTCSESGKTVTLVAGSVTETATCSGGNTFSKAMNLSTLTDGAITVTADMSDTAGNAATQASIAYEKDTVAPSAPSSIALQSPNTSPNTDDTPTIRIGGLTSGFGVSFYADATCATPSLKSSGTAAAATLDLTSSALSENDYDFYALQTDLAGNPSDCSTVHVAYTYDVSVPTLAITSPAVNSYANSANVAAFTVSGTCSENGRTVYVVSGAVSGSPTCTAGAWTTDLDASSLAQGDFTVTADLADASGNNAVQASRVFKKDTVAPSAPSALTLQSPTTSPGIDSTPTITVDGLASGNTAALYTDASCTTPNLKGSGTASGATLDITSSAITVASHTFYALQTDPAGNPSSCSVANVVYEYDNAVPTLAITSPAANSYANAATVGSFTVSGTCSEVGQTVTVASGAVTGTVACSGGNTWSKALDYSSLSEGDFTVTADLDDAAGNHAVQATRVFKKDVTAPLTSTFDVSPIRAPASSPGNSATPTIRVSSVVSGNLVRLFTNNTCTTEVGSGTASGTTIDITTSALSTGTYSFYSTSTDPAGNISTCSSASASYEYDNSVPTIAITAPDANSYANIANVAAFTISGTCSEAGQTVTVAVGAVSGTVACSGGNTFSKSLNLTATAQGDFTATADMDDAAGNHATQSTRVFKKDTVAPSAPSGLALKSPATSPNTVSTPEITISGVTSGNAVAFYADSSCTIPTLKSSGTAAGTSIDLTSTALSENTYAFYANQTDAAGNESACSTATVAYVYDNSVPTITITSPATNTYVNANNVTSFTASGTCSEAGQTITVAGGAVTGTVVCANDHTWSKALDYSSLGEADFVITADMDDAAGNHAVQAYIDLTIDVTAPASPSGLVLKSPTTTPATDSTPEITVSGVVSGNTVNFYADSSCTLITLKGTGTASGTNIDLTSSALTANSYSFYADTTDRAGNTSTCSAATVAYEYDNTTPTVAITSPAADTHSTSGNYTAFTISGTCSVAGRTVYIVAGAVSATPTCAGDNTWTTDLDLTTIALGAFSVTADMSNAVGTDAVQSTRNFVKDVGGGGQAAPPNPSSLTGIVNSSSVISLNWVTGGGTTADYQISYATGATAPADCASGSQISEADISGSSKSITGLTANTQYSFRVCAINGNGTPDVSSGITITKTTSAAHNFPIGNSILDFQSPNCVVTDKSGNFYVYVIYSDGIGYSCNVRKFSPSGNELLRFGTNGTGVGEFDCSTYQGNIAVDSSENIYYVDPFYNRIQKFDSSGIYLTSIGTFGAGNGELDQPSGLSIDTSDNIYVADKGNNRVQKFNSSGTYQAQFGSVGITDGLLSQPFTLDVDSSGNIFVGDGTLRIQKFNSAGVHQFTFGGSGSGADQFSILGAIAVAPNGKIYATDSDYMRTLIFNSDGSYNVKLTTTGQHDTAPGIDVDLNGNVYIADLGYSRVQKFNAAGTFVRTYGLRGQGNGQFDSIGSIKIDSDGNIYAADTNNNRIQKFSSSGMHLLSIGSLGSTDGKLHAPYDVEVNSNGDIYVVDTYNHRIQKFDSNGTYIAQWGASGTGNGQFDYPMGLAIYANFIYVADTSNNRIQKFSLAGVFDSKFGTVGSGHGNFSAPGAVAVDTNGNVYVADSGNNRIEKYDSNNAYVSTISAGLSQPSYVTVDPSGKVYAIGNDTGVQKLFIYSTLGALINSFSVPDNTRAVAVDADGNLLIGDSIQYRIRKYNATGSELFD